jgi:adenine-specific DNA methylase
LLKETGKLGFVIPAELLQVSYALILRKYLSFFFNKINIISFRKLVFPSVQQEVLLLLCEKNKDKSHPIEHIELNDIADLCNLNTSKLKSKGKKIDNINNKWTYYFLEQKEIDFLESILKNGRISTIGSFADIEVGITTGANDYFTVPNSIVDKYNLQNYAKPMVGRSVQVPSAIFTKADWRLNSDLRIKSNLLTFPPRENIKNHTGVSAYIKTGEDLGIHKGYKTGIREDWFVIPSIKLSDAFFIRRNNVFPRLILNRANAYTTDTMHRVFIHNGINKNAFIASYYNSLSLAFSEIVGRSYGGGVLELMPSETEEILLPYKLENASLLGEIDTMLREKMNINQILERTDKILLSDNFGFSSAEIKMANTIWKKLSYRRLNRKQR